MAIGLGCLVPKLRFTAKVELGIPVLLGSLSDHALESFDFTRFQSQRLHNTDVLELRHRQLLLLYTTILTI